MSAPIVCLFLGHTPSTHPNMRGGLLRVSDKESELTTFLGVPCERCGVLFCHRLPEPEPLPSEWNDKPNLWKILLRIAPKARLNDLSDALFDQGFVVDMVKTTTRVNAPDGEPEAPSAGGRQP